MREVETGEADRVSTQGIRRGDRVDLACQLPLGPWILLVGPHEYSRREWVGWAEIEVEAQIRTLSPLISIYT